MLAVLFAVACVDELGGWGVLVTAISVSCEWQRSRANRGHEINDSKKKDGLGKTNSLMYPMPVALSPSRLLLMSSG